MGIFVDLVEFVKISVKLIFTSISLLLTTHAQQKVTAP